MRRRQPPRLKHHANGFWYAHFYSDAKRHTDHRSMGTKDPAEAALRFARWTLTGGAETGPVGEEKPRLTIGTLWQVYDEKHIQKRIVSVQSAENSWKNLQPHFAHLLPTDIDQTVVEDYEELRVDGDIGRPSVPATVRRELLMLRACLNWNASVERGKRRLLDKADVPAFRLPDESCPRDRWLTTEEIIAMMAAAREMHPGEPRMSRGERFLCLALETAARKQAILDLTWDRVDFETRVIHYAVSGRKITKKRRPSVPISDTLLPALQRMYKERTGRLVMDHGGNVWATVQAIVVRAGLAPKQTRGTGEAIKGTGISPHTFRHTAATYMARRGVPLFDIAGVLGNTVAMVEKVYSHHCPGRLRAAVNSISSGFWEAAE